jgi:hypothetical protein
MLCSLKYSKLLNGIKPFTIPRLTFERNFAKAAVGGNFSCNDGSQAYNLNKLLLIFKNYTQHHFISFRCFGWQKEKGGQIRTNCRKNNTARRNRSTQTGQLCMW